MSQENNFLYIISCRDSANVTYVKIGVSWNPKLRRSQLQTGNPLDLDIDSLFKTGKSLELENMMHKALKQYNTTGEWFKLNNKGLELLNKIKGRLSDYEYYYETDKEDGAGILEFIEEEL